MSVKLHEEWQNRKNGNLYEVIGIAICCDNDKGNQKSIIYTAEGKLFTRCEAEFLEKFSLKDKGTRREKSKQDDGAKL